MTATAERTAVTIDLGGCGSPHCLEMAWKLKHQLDPKYSRGASVLPLANWVPRRTARKRAERAERLGYRFSPIVRQAFTDDIYQINTSAPERQGRPMSAGYLEPPVYGPNPVMCGRHHVYTYGVLNSEKTLVAYLWLYRSGELALVSSILGHADHLKNDVMYLLFAGMAAAQAPMGGTVFYNLWNSGTEGLRFFKERLGLVEGDIEWTL